jgi:hypothetical protein
MAEKSPFEALDLGRGIERYLSQRGFGVEAFGAEVNFQASAGWRWRFRCTDVDVLVGGV